MAIDKERNNVTSDICTLTTQNNSAKTHLLMLAMHGNRELRRESVTYGQTCPHIIHNTRQFRKSSLAGELSKR